MSTAGVIIIGYKKLKIQQTEQKSGSGRSDDGKEVVDGVWNVKMGYLREI